MPNIQNIPIRTEQGKAIREAFEPDKETSTDYAELEMILFIKHQTDICRNSGLQTDNESVYAFIQSALLELG